MAIIRGIDVAIDSNALEAAALMASDLPDWPWILKLQLKSGAFLASKFKTKEEALISLNDLFETWTSANEEKTSEAQAKQ